MKKIYDSDIQWEGSINKADKEYKFQPELTDKLDKHEGDFTEITLLEIVLWKTNRYPEINSDLLQSINELRREYSKAKAITVLKILLGLRGFDLPMASTVLRFACPEQLQIIDQRVYRFITEGTDTLDKPHNIDKKVDMYFDYLDRLRTVCQAYNIPFYKADRILYQLDKELNKDSPIRY